MPQPGDPFFIFNYQELSGNKRNPRQRFTPSAERRQPFLFQGHRSLSKRFPAFLRLSTRMANPSS